MARQKDGVTRDIGQFALVPEWILDAEISDRALRLYAVLARYADSEGASYPARRTLAKRLRCSVDTVDRAVKELIAAHALEVTARTDDGGDRTSNLYLLRTMRPGGLTDAATSSRTDAATGSRTDAAGTRTRGELEPPERENTSALAARESHIATPYDPRKGTKIEGRNHPWDALARVTNSDERAESGRIATALKTIRRLVVETHSEQTFADPGNGEWFIAREIEARARLYRQRWPNVELTPTALAANWSRVATAKPGSDPMATMEAAQRGIDAARRTA